MIPIPSVWESNAMISPLLISSIPTGFTMMMSFGFRVGNMLSEVTTMMWFPEYITNGKIRKPTATTSGIAMYNLFTNLDVSKV